MKPTPSRPRVRPAAPHERRQRVPAALTRGTERLDGLAMLEEIRGDLGLVLWRSFRNVSLWADTPEERRGGVFSGAAAPLRERDLGGLDPDAELHAPLSVVVSLLERPGQVDVPRLVHACRRISQWAEQRGWLATALAFAQAAALVAPDSPDLAYTVGKLARRRAEFDRAESWYVRAVVQGRQKAAWRPYALAFSGLGNLHLQKGNFPEARRYHLRSLRAARRHGLLDIEGDALHDLCAIAIETGQRADAMSYAQAAARAYGPGHRNLPRLAHDVAHLWILEGSFTHAIPVVEAILPHIAQVDDQLLGLGDLARAAGGAGDRARFEAARAEIGRVMECGGEDGPRGGAARAMLGIAHGAASLGEWEMADWAAAESAELAARLGEAKIRMAAEAVRESVAGRRSSQAPVADREDALADLLAGDLVRALSGTALAGVS